jgi:hypothetical protein
MCGRRRWRGSLQKHRGVAPERQTWFRIAKLEPGGAGGSARPSYRE